METQTKSGMVRAIDIHHHYFPPGLVDEVSKHGKALGVEASVQEGGQVTVSFSGKKILPSSQVSLSWISGSRSWIREGWH